MKIALRRIPSILALTACCLTPPMATAEDPPVLVFSCAADNDLYRVLAESDRACPRFGSPTEALRAAPRGGAVLLLADGYPAERTPLTEADFDLVTQMNLRLYIEYPSWLKSIDFGTPAYQKTGHYGAVVERTVLASDFFEPRLKKMRIVMVHDCHYLPVEAPDPHMVLTRVEGYDSAVYGITEAAHPLLFEHPDGNILVATTKLSQFVTARYSPAEAWAPIWESILAWLAPGETVPTLTWTPTVRPMYGPDQSLPADALDQAIGRGADYYRKSRLLIHENWPPQEGVTGIDPDWPVGDGTLGIAECYISKRIFADGSQAVSRSARADCNLEAALGLSSGFAFGQDASHKTLAHNFNDLVFFDSVICQLHRADPNNVAYGLLSYHTGDNTGVYWGDDNARALLSAIGSAALLKTDRWDASILRGILANFRTTGIHGFRPQNIDDPTLQQNGWRHFFNLEHIDHCPHMQCYIWATYFWLYHKTGYKPLLERGREGVHRMMEAYPDWRLEANRYEQERCRMLLPLAWLVRADDTPQHRRWLDEMARYVIGIQDESGAIPQIPGHVVEANSGYGTGECALVHEAGDPATDALYSINFAFLGMHEAAAATGNAEYAQSARKMAEFFIRTQTQSETHPELDGTWYRGFDYRKWDYWASDGDWGWGVWTNEIGWTHSWILAVLALQKMETSLWDLSAGSPIARHFENHRTIMLPDDATPAEAPPRYTIEDELDLTTAGESEVAACIDEFRSQHAAAGETEAGPIVLENDRLVVAIDRRSGAIRSIRDKEPDMTYSLSGIGFSVTTDGGALRADAATSVSADGASSQFFFSGNGLDVTLHYRLGINDPFIEKWLEIEARDGKPYFLNEVCLEDMELGSQFCEIHFHDDQTKWHCPINFFLRGEQGGCYAGLQYPYWEKDVRGHRGYRLGYMPNYPVAAGETFISEKYFLGVYRYEGIYRYAHGPFPGPARPTYLTFNNASVSHYSDTRDVAPEVLDWGEVWAMQKYMRHALPPHKMPEDGYWAWVNAWWHWAYTWKHITREDLDVMRDGGIHDVMTQEMWFGHSQHPLMADYVADFDPAQPPDFRAAKHIEELHAYGKQIGVYVASFSSPPISFTRRPEWLSLNRDGAPITYIQGVKANCPASDDYMNYLTSLYLHIFDRYEPRFWGFDGRWTSFREVPYDDGRGIEPDPCFAANHGHPPGDNRYREYRNIMRLLAELRRQHPRMCLETYYGLKRVYPWAARELNATENYYESNGSDIDRFQQWHNQNGRFLPPDRNYAAVFGRTPEAFRHSFIACLASAPYCQVGAGLQHLGDPETRNFFRQWRDWGSRHHEYLQVKRDIFPTFGYAPLDGSAHILEDRGFLFLFPTGLQPNTHTPANDEGIEARVRQWPNALRAVIKLNHWIGLERNPDLLLKVVEVYPRENRVLGTYRYGQEFVYDQPANSAAILSLTPATSIEPATDQPFDAAAPTERVRVVRAFEEDVMTTAQFLGMSNAERADAFLGSNRLETASGRWNLVDGVALEQFEAGDVNQFASQAVDLQDLRLNPPATVATWVRVAEVPEDLRVFSQLSGSTAQAGAIRLDGAQVQVWNGSAWQAIISDGVLPGRWLHIAVTFHPDGHATGYLNGIEQISAPSRLDFFDTPAGVGAKFLGQHGNGFVGQMRDFRIHRRVLPAGELARLAGGSSQ